MIKFSIPIRTKNPLNGSQGRTCGAVIANAKRRKRERQDSRLVTLASIPSESGYVGVRYWSGNAITLRRVSPRALDGDGLQAALKSVRDGIADALGINDGSDAVTWKYEHRRGKPREYCVEVEILPNQEQTREAL